jgi:signal transduction histidine kinase
MLSPLVCAEFGDDAQRSERTLRALQKLVFFDAKIAMETYIERREGELEYLNRELASQSHRLARDFESQGAELRRTTRRAQAAERLASMGTLVAGLAHEIGTPMGVIQGHAKLLESSVEGDQAGWRLRTIREQIGRISRIIESLLNMARPRHSEVRPVDLDALLDATLSFLAEKFERRRIKVVRSFDPVPSVTGDAERLQQLFLNLFMNATDAMPEGGELRVELLEANSGGGVLVRVADTGIGIQKADLERIFDPFFTSKEAGHGNGLGLAVAQGIVTDHGGRIEVESVPGEGTEFRIQFLPEAPEA